jgi:hypothetical protein
MKVPARIYTAVRAPHSTFNIEHSTFNISVFPVPPDRPVAARVTRDTPPCEHPHGVDFPAG